MILLLDQQLIAHMVKSGISETEALERESMFLRLAILRQNGLAIVPENLDRVELLDRGEDYGARYVELLFDRHPID